MLRSPAFLLGVAAGAVATWIFAARRGPALIAATPYLVKPIRREGRLGRGWGQGGAGGYR